MSEYLLWSTEGLMDCDLCLWAIDAAFDCLAHGKLAHIQPQPLYSSRHGVARAHPRLGIFSAHFWP